MQNDSDSLLERAFSDAAGFASKTHDLPVPPPGYELRRAVSRGGQGIVYEGVHIASERRVALKLLRDADIGSAADEARFAREIALLNRIDHSGIVLVRDSMRFEGRIWHAMDFIDGVPLDHWAEAHRDDARAIVTLMAEVAEAVAAAHARGVVHRDLKPSNILVDPSDHPHVLDFGLAKSIDESASHHALTVSGQFVGSIAWASPEQAEGRSRDVDLRTDVYALGLILYHALSGAMPYPTGERLRDTLEHIVSTDPVPLRRRGVRIDADVDVIALTCLQKAPARRYQGAAELAADLRRSLANKPIAARSDSSVYLAKKVLSRYRVPVIVGAGFVITVVVGLIIGILLLIEKNRQSENAKEQSAFLSEMITSGDPLQGKRDRGLGRDARVIDVIDEAANSLDGRFTDPRVDAFLRVRLGVAYHQLTSLEQAAPLIERANEDLKDLLPLSDPERLWTIEALAILRVDQGRAAEAEEILRPALAAARDEEIALDLREDLGRVLVELNRFAEAMSELNGVMKRREELATSSLDDKLRYYNTIEIIAGLLLNSGRAADAEPLYQKALDGFTHELRADHMRTVATRKNYAACLVAQHKLDEARPLIEQVLAIRRAKLGPSHMRTLESLIVLAELEYASGNNERLIELLEELVARSKERGEQDAPTMLGLRRRLALAWLGIGHCEQAAAELRAVLDRQRATIGPMQLETIETQRLLAKALRTLERYDEAELLLREAIAALDAMPNEGPSGATTVYALVGLGLTQLERGDVPASIATLEDAFERGTSARGPDDAGALLALESAWSASDRAGDWARAERHAAAMIAAHDRGAANAKATREEWESRRAESARKAGEK